MQGVFKNLRNEKKRNKGEKNMCVASKLMRSKLNKDEKHTCATMVCLAPAPCLEFTISMMVAPSTLDASSHISHLALHVLTLELAKRVSGCQQQNLSGSNIAFICCHHVLVESNV